MRAESEVAIQKLYQTVTEISSDKKMSRSNTISFGDENYEDVKANHNKNSEDNVILFILVFEKNKKNKKRLIVCGLLPQFGMADPLLLPKFLPELKSIKN